MTFKEEQELRNRLCNAKAEIQMAIIFHKALEREECAEVAENCPRGSADIRADIAAAIRARGEE